MDINYAVSLWNYGHYSRKKELKYVIDDIRKKGWGIELWQSILQSWPESDFDIYNKKSREHLKKILGDMNVSLHTDNPDNFKQHQEQIRAAEDLGAQVIVLHPPDLVSGDSGKLDVKYAKEVLAYAGDKGIKLALENGPLPFLENAVNNLPDLNICIDIGHIYYSDHNIKAYLDILKDRLIHLHLQDIVTEAEKEFLKEVNKDHFTPGTGGIPDKDWNLLWETLKEINFNRTAVFEIRPRNPLQNVFRSLKFLDLL